MGRNNRNVSLISFSVILPSVQFLLALGLWEWSLRIPWPKGIDTLYYPTPMLVCYGISAPALLFKVFGTPFRGTGSWSAAIFGFNLERLGFDLESVLFFLGVIVLWYVVGTVLDRLNSSRASVEMETSFGKIIRNVLLMILGVLLFFIGLRGLLGPWPWRSNPSGNIVACILLIVWSFILIGFPGVGLLNGIRRKHSRGELAA
jgi:hypothetical protein